MRVGAIDTGCGGYMILGAWVFAEQIGFPLPATPALLAAGALAAAGRLNAALVIATAVAASVLADCLWYRVGILGTGVIDRFLRHSKTLRRAEQLAAQYGSRTLVFAKFVPGLSLVAPPLSGVSGTRVPRFLLFDGLGSFIWAACWIGIGYFVGIGGSASPISLSPMFCASCCAAIAVAATTFRSAGWLWNKLRRRSLTPPIDATLIRTYHEIPDRLTWLANLITGETQSGPDPAFEPLCSGEAAKPFFHRWSNVWFRKLVLAKALGRVAAELKGSASRTGRLTRPKIVPGPLPLVERHQLERALIALDVFPRCAMLLTMFEQLSFEDTTILLDADKTLIETAHAIAMAELYANLAHQQGWAQELPPATQPAIAIMQPTAY